MANRSYLYSTNIKPRMDGENCKITGISEFAYEIPIIHRILISCEMEACESSIWERDDKIALIGDYSEGVEALKQFFKAIKNPEAKPLIDEALEFLDKPENINKYFILEAGEIYDYEGEDYEGQNLNTLKSIKENLSNEIALALENINTKSDGLFKKLFGKKQKTNSDPLEVYYMLGLGGWSNILYYGEA